ncbi:LLM class flavin-dependent oxidoreductase [Nocardia sp. NPDC051756]|uniref:LLM class flavin-dependent oxidoreductase n=1 Tax=Nocardia sp. NPDC051756 TaxID=3154751 RepID=UPI00343FBB57
MDLGFHISDFEIDGGTAAIAGELARIGVAAEASGATWLSFMDHYFQIALTGFPTESAMLEGYTTLGYLAAHTSTIGLGLLVTGVTYRHPGLLAKIVATLDVLSGGRAMLGVGAAWFEREHRGLGVPFPSVAERFERLLIAGGGERKTLRLVAQYGDACNLVGSSPADVGHKLDVLRRHCDDVGRDFDEIRTTIVASNPRPTPDTCDEFVRGMEDYAKLGVHEVLVIPIGGAPAAWIDGMAPSVPRLAELG